ncbi:glycosyltransferase family 2 protein [Changchengzhania lutea]|uniref:glycosyltransferase family 2 protein n=1 Tax=Changchengzhania lutea TaxID=2049305 RepID=UPI00115CC21A|nr:glycosyltransferase family 2 protein [Changchengzhania lutea]
MNFSLIVCTYMRAEPLLSLLRSVNEQTLYPNEIIIVDGSTNNDTQIILNENSFKNLNYFKVEDAQRGLTKQRNFGIEQVSENSGIICFLDDDVILGPAYFEQLMATYVNYPDAIAVGGYITNEVTWQLADDKKDPSKFYYDGWMRKESFRFKIRQFFGLQPDTNPGFLPTFSHGRSIGYLPPSNNIYPVEFFMGGVSSYKKEVFSGIKFSTYFEGYGLYEDLEFCLRVSRLGKLYLNTAARLEHHHEAAGRPDNFVHGKMIVRNSWYVWKVKYPDPTFKATLKFHLTVWLLMIVRFSNSFYGNNKKEALTETFGRFTGWLSLFYNKPNMQ